MIQCCVPCRADWSMRDLCALLPDEGPFFPRRPQVRDFFFVSSGFGDWFVGFTSQHPEKICKCSSYTQNTSAFCLSHLTFSPSCSDNNEKDTLKIQSHQRTSQTGLYGTIQFFFVTVILTVVGSRVASLVVLEFCLRAVSGWVTAGPVRNQLNNAINNFRSLPQLTCVVLSLIFSPFCLVYFLRWWLVLITLHLLFWLIRHTCLHVSPFFRISGNSCSSW